MILDVSAWRRWPALADPGAARRWKLVCDHTVWEIEGDDGAPRVLAASKVGDDDVRRRMPALDLRGRGDLRPVLGWRSSGGLHQTLALVPVAGRNTSSSFRGHLLEWQNARGLPAALAALALLPKIAELAADMPVDHAGPATATPTVLDPPVIYMDEIAIGEAVDAGCRPWSDMDAAALAAFYAALLAGNHDVPLPAAAAVLPPLSFAVLLLPLERALADRLALCSGRSTRHPGPQVQAAGAIDEVMRWHVSGFDDDAPQALSGWHHEPSDEHRRLAEAITRALQRADPTELDRPASVAAVAPRQPPPGRGEADRHRAAAISAAVPEPSSPADTRELRIWGSASAGKTVYLSQLFMKHRHGGDSDWCVRLPAGSDPETVQFYEARLERFKKDNAFPAPTSRGEVKEIVYHLVNERTGQRVGIAMEDRPGADFENVDADMARRLAAADGLLMLLDPRRDPADQTHEVLKTLLAMQQVRMDDGRDPRPLAVCISKCDELVGSAEAYRIALQTPEMLPGIALATSVREALVHYFETWRVFALSAAGLRRRHGAVEPGVFYDESFKLRINADAEPLNLLEPLLWLLEHVDR